jgi:hypothetical protein
MTNISIYLNTTLWQFLKKQAENPTDLMGHMSKTHQKPAKKKIKIYPQNVTEIQSTTARVCYMYETNRCV